MLDLPPASAPALIVDGDLTRLEQVVWNLVNNALKFSSPNARVRAVLSQVGERVQLDVIDNGIGLPKDELDRVFDLFGQAVRSTANHQREGLGIGLSLVRQLVEAHGGNVTAHSAGLGQGCTFRVSLPVFAQATVAEAEGHSEQTERLQGVKILLVDDSPDVIEVLTLLLEMEDADVTAFTEPLKALEAAAETRYDVVISDIGMPLMDGHEFIRALRQLAHYQHTPAVALTGYGVSSNGHTSNPSDFDRYLAKPVQYEELIVTLEGLYRNER